ncbi:probable glycosidase CRH2 [[Candida] jaroonii]|uniref:Probable glycosidase CRH2 n=1 Tax=[Candida] jaroonii TaxID=467808 RepID=A0ACA9Y307_9ASCO|nr:probable glycosidase CRH2 [[Candida] jaroonii]
MKRSFNLYLFLAIFLFIVNVKCDDDVITCNSTQPCPEDKPCCSQYGTCGTGAYCLGGCDIRFSFNLSACMPMPVMEKYSNDFDNTKILMKQEEYLGNFSETDWVYSGYVDTNDDAILLQMPNESTGTVISSTKYIWYGKISATIKSSHDRGVITAFILFSDVQDEVDYEWLGYNLTNPQSNYYFQGLLNYTNTKNSTVSDTFENWHFYEFDWNEDRIEWLIDGEVVRTLEKKDTYNSTSKKYEYPQTPSRVQFSLWPGGDSKNALGTIEWAGGEIDWDSDDIKKYGYYYSYLKNVTIEPYDMPDFVAEVDDPDADTDEFHAFLYNSTDGYDTNVYLTNKKTWLGSGDATGLDPDNDSDDEGDVHTETVVSGSGSSKTTQIRTSTASKKTANVPDDAAATTTTSNDYNPSAGIGGFIQDSSQTSSVEFDSGSKSGSTTTNGGSHVEGLVGVISLLGFVGLSLFV